MQVKITGRLSRERLNCGVVWQFSGLERGGREVESPTRPDPVGVKVTGVWATRRLTLNPYFSSVCS
jgi:hypothetical protein